ncbi:MAG: O-succinylhomoserine sulfhydrylase [Alphaproteobacteria bacterium]|nr:O-succinylhomoserine sulfhydrylase [Alphaproteobacteria bacterium]
MPDLPDARSAKRELRPRTQMVRGGTWRSSHGETSEAIFMNSGYAYESAEAAEAAFVNAGSRFVYSRYASPTVNMFEERLRLVEGAAACRSTASGMAAVFAALLCQLRAGDRVVSSRALFGSCHYIIAQLLPRYGVEAVLVDGRNLDEWRRALAPGARAVFCESPSNPSLELVDIAAVGELARRAGARFIVDNIFATPLAQRPLALGADIVVYSTTKHIDGQGRSLGGAVLGGEEFIAGELAPFLRHTGPALSPFNAWLLLKGLETFDLRVRQHVENAAALALFLEAHPKVERVSYPGLPSHPQAALARRQMTNGGSLIAFDVRGGKAAAFRFLDALRIIDISNNLGDAKSLITHPATTTHQTLSAAERQTLGIGPALLRLSVGLEDVDDLTEDLETALDAA